MLSVILYASRALRSFGFHCASKTTDDLIVPLHCKNKVASEEPIFENFRGSLLGKINMRNIISFLSKVVSSIVDNAEQHTMVYHKLPNSLPNKQLTGSD